MRNRKPPEWFTKAVFYEIYPQTFFDSNGDGVGDIPGMTAKLDYIESLGITAIWVNPCFQSPFNDAGYDVSDYYTVAPRYGTNEDLKEFIEGAHARDMRVILDLVPGHTSIEHPWFVSSAELEENEYSHRYIWTDSVWEDTSDFYLESVRGYSRRNAKFMANFFYTQPALNYGFAEPDPKRPWQKPVDHPAVQEMRQELLNIITYWLDFGVDGFRVDMAYSLVKKDPGRKKTIEFWHWVREHLDRSYPEAVLVAEWHDPVQALQAHFDACFLLPFDGAGLAAFRNERDRWSVDYSTAFFHPSGQGTIMPLLLELDASLSGAVRGYPALAGSNHDVMRMNVDRSADELEMIHAFTLLMPGVPFIYYGEEIGMADSTGIPSVEGGYERTSARTPMQWTRNSNAGFSTADESMLYTVPVAWDHAATVEAQDDDPSSLLNRVRQLIAFVRREPAFDADGTFQVLYADPYEYPLVFTRSASGARFLVAMNPSKRDTAVDVNLNEGKNGKLQSQRVFGHDAVTLSTNGSVSTVRVPASSYAVFTLDMTREESSSSENS